MLIILLRYKKKRLFFGYSESGVGAFSQHQQINKHMMTSGFCVFSKFVVCWLNGCIKVRRHNHITWSIGLKWPHLPRNRNEMNYVWEEIWKSDVYKNPNERASRAIMRLQRIKMALTPLTDLGRVIELGCGDGSFAFALTKDGGLFLNQYLGLDRSSTAIARAVAQVADKRCKFDLVNIETLQLPQVSADTILMLGVLEHLEEPDRALRTIREACAPDGRVIFTTSNSLSMMYVNRRIREWAKRWPYGFQKNYTPSEFAQQLEVYFDVVRTETIHGDWDFPFSAFVDRVLSTINTDISRYILVVCKPKK